MSWSHRSLATLALVVPMVVATAAACGGPATAPRDSHADPVAISVSDCGSGWRPEAAGAQVLTVRNVDARPGEVQLVGRDPARRGKVFADIEPFGPGTTRTLQVRLGPGRYGLRCLIEDQPAVQGPVVTVTGSARSGPGVVPVTDRELIGPAQRYTAWVAGRIPDLVGDTRRLLDDLRSGDRVAARRDWLTAHLDYERLGAAYGAFGELDDDIDGLPYGLPGGVRSRRWRGFHAIEHGLWGSRPAMALLARAATRLVGAEQSLRTNLERNQIDGTTLAIRAHEISENVLQFQLTGLDDFGSHTSLATAQAALEGTVVVLGLVRPVLRKRMPTTGALLRETRGVLALVRRRAAHAAEVTDLPRRAREQIDAAVNGLCEHLAPVAATLEPRRTS